jgi:uncharacterized protein (TIGR02996 family)
MSDSAARGFLEDIIAHPDDNAPRLIYADWLDEHGDGARAEFIRVQVERSTLPAWDARQLPLRLRERALMEQYGKQWEADLPNLDGITWLEFRRGFMATASIDTFAVLQANAGACWAATPLEAVSLYWPRRREPEKAFARLAGLRELSISGTLIDLGDVYQLAAAPLLSTLRALSVRDCNLGPDGFYWLLASVHLGQLSALRAGLNFIGNEGVRALHHAASLTSLEELDLSEAGSYGRYGEDPIIEAAGVEALVTWPGMTRLRSLTLSGNAVGQEGLRALLQSPRATGLKELVLRGNGLTSRAMAEFGAAQAGLKLDALDLGENLIGDVGAADLALAPCLRELKVLQLDRCEILSSGARWLVNAPFVDSLRRLNVNYDSFAPEGLYRLLEKKPPWLHTLQMVDNDLGDEGAAHLAESPASDALLEVDLAGNGLGFHAANALVRSKHLRNLLILRLKNNPIDKLARADLAASALGKRLAVLEMTDRDWLEMTDRPDEGIPF